MIKWNSSAYWEAIELRNQLLKKTSGKAIITQAPLDEKNDIHLAVIQNGKVIGTLLLHPIDPQLIQIKQVAIDPAYQGGGLGRKLVQYAEWFADKLGYSFLFLTGRQQAWMFYEKLGYHAVSDCFQEGKIMLKVFRKELHTPLSIKERMR